MTPRIVAVSNVQKTQGETNMANADDVQADEISLDSFLADEQDTSSKPEPKAPEAPAEAAKTEPQATPSVVEDKTKPVEEPAKPEDKPADAPNPEGDKPAVEEGKEEPQTPKADERKQELNTEIRDLVAQRNALRESVAKANGEAYAPSTEQELVDSGMSATDAKVEAIRQSMEMRDYNEKVAEVQLTIESEATRILRDFAWANPDSPDFQEDLSNEAAELLKSNLILDQNTGQVIGANMSPYQLYKVLDKASSTSAVKAQVQAQKDTEQMLANADTPTSVAPPKEKADPLMDLWKAKD